VETRVTIEDGDFFETVPSGGDAYLLSHIIHDWNDEECLTILGNCRKAMKPNGRLLIVEMVLPQFSSPADFRTFSQYGGEAIFVMVGHRRIECRDRVRRLRSRDANMAWPRS
jgi:O-methyltransferase domain